MSINISPKIYYCFFLVIVIPFLFCNFFTNRASKSKKIEFLTWQEGYLDIHHINVGRGNAIFMIFPDGTNLLFDAGHIIVNNKNYSDVHPNDSLMPGAWMAHYIKQVLPIGANVKIDYAIPSHFHGDHFGEVLADTKMSKNGAYQLSGITEVGDVIPIKKLIDRGYPDYNYPVDLREFYGKIRPRLAFTNYLKFIEYQRKENGMQAENLIAGSNKQIRLLNNPSVYPNFSVRNLKVDHIFWNGKDEGVFYYDFKGMSPYDSLKHNFSENPLSIALKISYGDFDYYTGGDLTGITEGNVFDMETPLADVVGQVEAMTLNHHGWKDACNEYFLQKLNPKVIAHQSLHDPHFQENVINRLAKLKADVFTLNASAAVEQQFGKVFNKVFDSKAGHVLIRVYPGGKKFRVLTLNDEVPTLKIKKDFGFYNSYK